jgi:hypothetical protein
MKFASARTEDLCASENCTEIVFLFKLDLILAFTECPLEMAEMLAAIGRQNGAHSFFDSETLRSFPRASSTSRQSQLPHSRFRRFDPIGRGKAETHRRILKGNRKFGSVNKPHFMGFGNCD